MALEEMPWLWQVYMDISSTHCVASRDFIAGSEAATGIRGLPSDKHIVQGVSMGLTNGYWLTVYFRRLAFGRRCVVKVKSGRSPAYILVVSYPIEDDPEGLIEWVAAARGYACYHVQGDVCTYVATICGRASKEAVETIVQRMEAWTCSACLGSTGGKIHHCAAQTLLRTHAATVIQAAFRAWHSNQNQAAVRIQRAAKEW